MPTFEEFAKKEALHPFRGPYGSRYAGTIGRAMDRVIQGVRAAAKVAMPSYAPDDALGYVGDARNLDRYPAESSADFRAVLQNGWREWFDAGTPAQIEDVVTRIGYQNVTVIPHYVATTLTPAPPAPWDTWWSLFFVSIAPSPYTKKFWGSPPAWGAKVPSQFGFPDGYACWGGSFSSIDVAILRHAIRKWAPANDICIVVFKDTAGTALFDSNNIFLRAK